jgi:DNA-3-methyladenine glycosylase
VLVHDAPEGRISGRIVEAEAYLPADPASHSFRGPTRRNASMYLKRGHAYVYRIYGTSLCVNVSSDAPGVGAAVLIRAAAPIDGIGLMRGRRNGMRDGLLARGPGRLTAALGITLAHDGADLCAPGAALWLGTLAREPSPRVGESVRIGITRAAGEVLRFYEKGSTHVSGPRRLSP